MCSNIEEDRINLMIDRKIEDWKKELCSNPTNSQDPTQQAENQGQSTDTNNHTEELATEIHER